MAAVRVAETSGRPVLTTPNSAVLKLKQMFAVVVEKNVGAEPSKISSRAFAPNNIPPAQRNMKSSGKAIIKVAKYTSVLCFILAPLDNG